MAEDIGKTLHDELTKMGRLDKWDYVFSLLNNNQWDEAINYVASLAENEKPKFPTMAIILIIAIILIMVVF